jgi:hypothetical protein
MSMQQDAPRTDDEGDDLDQWLAELRGIHPLSRDGRDASESSASPNEPDAMTPGRLEGRWLRAAVVEAERRHDDSAAFVWQMQARLHQPKPASTCDPCLKIRTWLHSWWTGSGGWVPARRAVAAGAVVVVAWLWVGSPGMRDADVRHDASRGGGPGIALTGPVVVASTDPGSQRNALADRLVGAGFRVQRYENLGHSGLTVDLQGPLPPHLDAEVRALGAKPLVGVLLTIEFQSSPRP